VREEIVGQFSRQLDINDVKSIHAEDLTLEPRGSGFSVNLNYEIRVPIIYNIDAVLSFSHHRDIH
jgi:hypothetical protein